MIETLAALVTILLGIPALTKWGRNQYRNLWHFFTRYRPKVPREIVRFVPKNHHCWWSLGSLGGNPGMHVICDLFVTNISSVDALICNASIRKPKSVGHVFVRHSEDNYYGTYPIPPGFTTDARADFWIQPPVCKENEMLIADVELVDQLGNTYRINKIHFRPPTKKKEKLIDTPLEIVSDITNGVERKIVTVLQAEINRYKDCGRKVGGLGSITTTYKGALFNGVGTDCRIADSPKLQSIAPDTENAIIKSDNAVALINFYDSLEKDQKSEFIGFMSRRLSGKIVYAQVGYFILFVFYRIGHLKEALEVAKNNLQNDDEYGFSNFLMLLDGLLKYEYPKFSIEMLDATEQFLKGIKEHTFRIQERLAAIRSILLVKGIKQSVSR